MKKFAQIFAIILLPLSLTFCGSTKKMTNVKLQDKPPFEIITATFNTWVGGKPNSKGYSVYVSINNPEIQLDSIYFRNLKSVFNLETVKSKKVFVSSFVIPKQHDYNLDIDPKKEFGNKPPEVSIKFPFKLKENQAAVSYLFNNKTHYFIIENIKETETVFRY
jgi:hypothetical protein